MSIVEPREPAKPENAAASPDRVVVAIEAGDCPCHRRRVVLNGVFFGNAGARQSGRAVPNSAARAPQPAPSTWIGLIDRIVGSWAPTLRTAMLLIIMLTALIAVIAVSFGMTSALFAAGAATAVQLVTRRFARSR